VTLCRPLPYDLHAAPLEGGQWNPRKGCRRLPRSHAGRRRNDGLVEHVSSANSAAVLPSRALQRHPWRCGSTGRQDITTSATVRLPALRQCNPRADVRTTTKLGAPTPLPSKPLLDGHRTRRNVLPEARFARTANHSVALYTILSHVIRTMRHDYKPPPLGL
jgi:hypothetical protein